MQKSVKLLTDFCFRCIMILYSKKNTRLVISRLNLFFWRCIVGEFLKQFNVNGATLTFHGIAVTENALGEKTFHRCGMLWNPWNADDKTVETKVGIIVQGEVGENVKLTIAEGWAGKNRKIETNLKPFFQNNRDVIQRFASKAALFVAIEGNRETETWIISWWRMPSGRTFFDLAKNHFRVEELPGRTPQTAPDNSDGHKPSDELDQDTKDVIAGEQCDHGTEKNGGRHQKKHHAEVQAN